MRRFVLKLFLFIIVLVISYLACLAYTNIHNIEDARKLICREVLSCCYSHEVCGIDEALWSQYGNFNSSDTPPWIWHAKLRFIVECLGARPKIVLVERGLHDVTRDARTDVVADNVCRYLFLQLINWTCPHHINVRDAFGRILSSMPFEIDWIEIFNDNRILPKKTGPRKIVDIDPEDPVCRVFLNSLEKYIEYIKSIGAEPVLITMPCDLKYKNGFSTNVKHVWKMQTNHLIAKYGLRYFNYLDRELPPNAFRDPDHLNKIGRDVITNLLKTELSGNE